jgi:hypothetical protein
MVTTVGGYMLSGASAHLERRLRSGLEVLRRSDGRLLDLEQELDVGLGPLHLVQKELKGGL